MRTRTIDGRTLYVLAVCAEKRLLAASVSSMPTQEAVDSLRELRAALQNVRHVLEETHYALVDDELPTMPEQTP